MTINLKSALARLEESLRKHRPHYRNILLPGASATELASLEKSLSVSLPEEARTLLAWHNGQEADSIGGFERDWRLLSTTQIAEEKNDLLDPDAKDTGWSPVWIPFLGDGYGNYLCLDTSKTPPPLREFWAGNREHPLVAESLTGWIEMFVTAVEAGKYVEEPERGTFLRRR